MARAINLFFFKFLSRFNWVGGRQNGTYMKFVMLYSEKFKFDMYLLKFPTGAYLDNHRDKAPEGYEHHRLNIVLNSGYKGGKFIIKGKAQKGRIFRFRPDKYTHKVTPVKEGTRYVLSIGWLRRAKC